MLSVHREILEMLQLISEKLFELKCIVFSDEGCENTERFHLELCVKHCM
jgi:hypothetical protein